MIESLATATTTEVRVTTTRLTSDVPAYTRVVPPVRESDVDETIEDGLAMQAELERYQGQPSDSFVELDEFFRTLGD